MLDLVSKKKTWDGILWKLLSLNLFPFFLFSTKKKGGFLSFGFKLEKLWFFSFSYNGSQKCLSQRSDWEGPFSSLWWVHWRSFKKRESIKVAPIAFFDQSGSKKSLVQSVEAARLFEVRVLQTGSLSNPTLTWGLIYPLRFHKTELEDLCALFKKKKKKIFLKRKNFCHYCVQIGGILVLSFSDLGSQKCLNLYSDWNTICPLLWIQSWLFKKKLSSLLDSNLRNPGSFLFRI